MREKYCARVSFFFFSASLTNDVRFFTLHTAGRVFIFMIDFVSQRVRQIRFWPYLDDMILSCIFIRSNAIVYSATMWL